MIEWREDGILLATRKHGETAAIIDVFTPAHGRHLGVVRGGAGRRMGPILQPGAQLDLAWKARLEEHMGAFTVEPIRSRAAAVMGDPLALAGQNAVLGLLSFALAERQPHAELYAQTENLLDLIVETPAWPLAYLQWEMALLESLGFAMELKTCAVTGAFDDLAYISPKSGRAVSQAGAGDWADRLLPLYPVLLGQGAATDADIGQAMQVTGFFLEKGLAAEKARDLPDARLRLRDLLMRNR